jgi:hypothetical protein
MISNLINAQQIKAEQFSAALDSIRIQLKIPGMAVAVKKGTSSCFNVAMGLQIQKSMFRLQIKQPLG